MSFIVLLNGSINSGKSTVSQALRRLHPRMAHVEVDDLRAFIAWMPLAESIPLNLRNAAAVARNFLDYGLDVVLSSPLGQEDHAFLESELKPYAIHCFTLRPPLHVAQAQRGERILTPREIDRIGVHYTNGVAYPAFESTVIDNSGLTPEETALRILHTVQASSAI